LDYLYDKYEDDFQNGEYINKKFGIKILFDKNWAITSQYKDFSENQKLYARYFASTTSEVLFVGFNDDKKIGVKLTIEMLELKNRKYFDKIKENNAIDISQYKIKFLSDEDIFLRNLQTTNFVYETTINANNIFIFEVFLFKNNRDNFRFDFWTTKDNYTLVKKYIRDICETIDFPEGIKYNQVDLTSDTSITNDNLIKDGVIKDSLKNGQKDR